ncbi:MAG TPA: NRDE family protein [Steroidobacteraceae bacterium]|nr:NRDE family protein [Steroidobacteraceae bacterium]
MLVIAWRCHAQQRLVVAANRDEFHARPAAALAPWQDPPGIIGGRDLQAAGAWFAVDTHRRTGIVTNFREFGRRRRSAPSRGALIPGYLAAGQSPRDYLQQLETDAPGYAGFNLLLADRESLWYASNRADQFARELPPGIYGLSNEFLDTPWPKLLRVRSRFAALLESPLSADADALGAQMLTMLGDREPAPPDALAPGDLSPEWARKLSAPFVVDPGYGTRCSTVLTISADDSLRIVERRFAADGSTTGESEYSLNAGS